MAWLSNFLSSAFPHRKGREGFKGIFVPSVHISYSNNSIMLCTKSIISLSTQIVKLTAASLVALFCLTSDTTSSSTGICVTRNQKTNSSGNLSNCVITIQKPKSLAFQRSMTKNSPGATSTPVIP